MDEAPDFSYRDALPNGPAHRRGAGLNLGNRFEKVRLHVLGEELDRQWVEREENGESGPVRVERQVFFDKTRTIINKVAATSDVPFDWTVNPYRGCEHGCIYCRNDTRREWADRREEGQCPACAAAGHSASSGRSAARSACAVGP
jgi:hypothetical protein